MKRIVGVLLAAGRSTRFGGPKLLAPLVDGTPLGVAAARALRAGVPEVVAVVHPADRDLAEALAASNVRVVACVDAEAGMGASLAAGVTAAVDASGWVVALADMPYIKVSTIAAVAHALAAGAPLAAPFHHGRRGHPVGFGSEFGPVLRTLQGDRGARELIAHHADRLQRLEVDDPGVLLDVDTPADLNAGLTR